MTFSLESMAILGRVVLVAATVLALHAAAEAPPLPEGLAGTDAPAASSAPPLPEGLGAETGGEEPALPPGLATQESGPALPPGLAEKAPGAPESETPERGLKERWPRMSGFFETRAGVRLQEDRAQPDDATLGEARLQLRASKTWSRLAVDVDADTYLDGVLESAEFDLRRLRAAWRPASWLDIHAGRQVLTWGTGDLLFINDLFPKDWPAFFIGRDVEYLKAPADAVRLGIYSDAANVEFVYTPQFAPDRYITGERISYWNPLLGRRAGADQQIDANPPSDWFTDDEFALRIYRNIGAYEFAVYGYSGFWKSPGGQRLIPMQATFPRLNVYGASLRGTLGKGVANIEIGYYDSRDDTRGSRPLVNNSEFRLLVGYERELAREFTGGFQYYLEHMMDYGAYRDTPLFVFMEPRDRDRHVFTVRLTKLLMNQNLTLSIFAYLSPSDVDAYLRPNVAYKVNDNLRVEAGANLFAGERDHTFFGQFEDNNNVYVGARYAF